MANTAPLQCSWPRPLDCDGLDEADRKRIQQIGFKQWLEKEAGRTKVKIRPITRRKEN